MTMFTQSADNEKCISTKLKKLQQAGDNDDPLPPLDVSLHSTGTEISGVTEVTLITTISEREKEMDRAMARLEQPQEHPVDALLRSMHGGGPIKIDTIPRPSVTLQEYVGARVYSFARNIGLAQNQAETFTRTVASSMNSVAPTPPTNNANATWSAKTEGRRKSRFAQFFQDRADTFTRNIEHLGSMLQEKIENNAAATTTAAAIEQGPNATEEPVEQGSTQEGKEEPKEEAQMLEMEVESQGKEEQTIAEKHQQSRQSTKEQ